MYFEYFIYFYFISSPVYESEYNAEDVLGRITRDSNGRIYKAKATTMTWFLDVSDTTDLPEVS